jgi:hypothetical protein
LEGKLNTQAVFGTLEQLRSSEDAKISCGVRLVCWIEGIERGLASPKHKRLVSPECRSKK